MDDRDYLRLTALITNAVLIKGIEFNYPALTIVEQDVLVIDILDRIARLHGWSLRREPVEMEDDE